MAFNYGYCIETGCGERFVRMNTSQRWCEKHGKIAQSLANSPAPIVCPVCQKKLIPFNKQQKFCGNQCVATDKKMRRRAEREKKDKNLADLRKKGRICPCSVKFIPINPNQKRCQNCIVLEKHGPLGNNKDEQIPCVKCKWAAPLKEATFGVECTIGRWLICKPLSRGAKPYEVRDEALDITA